VRLLEEQSTNLWYKPQHTPDQEHTGRHLGCRCDWIWSNNSNSSMNDLYNHTTTAEFWKY